MKRGRPTNFGDESSPKRRRLNDETIIFRAKVNDNRLLRSIINSISNVASKVNLDLSQECMSLAARSDSNVVVLDLRLDSDFFDEYRCDEPMRLGFNLDGLQNALGCANSNDSVTLSSYYGSDNIIVTIDGSELNSVFFMHLIEIDDSDELEIREFIRSTFVKMPSKQLSSIVRKLSKFGDALEISSSPDEDVVIFSTAGDLGELRMSLSISSDVEIRVQSSLKINCSMVIMTNCLKIWCISDKVLFAFGKKAPILIEFIISDENSFLRYHVCPFVEENDIHFAGLDEEDEEEES